MNKLLIVIAGLMLSGCAGMQLVMPIEGTHKRGGEKGFYASEAAWHALNVVDVGQTVNIANRPDCYYEKNPMTRNLIGRHPSESEVLALGVLYSVAYRGISEFLARKDTVNEYGQRNSVWHFARISWHTSMIAGKAMTVLNNDKIGLKPFKNACWSD